MASQVEHIKWVADKFMVDGFAFSNNRCQHYFLTHFHSDHTIGLRRGFSQGTIYCTTVTRDLLRHEFKLSSACRVQTLEYGQPITVEGVQVAAIPANHCPGACMFLFEVPRENNTRAAGSTAIGSHAGTQARRAGRGASGTKPGRAGAPDGQDLQGTEVILHTGDFRWQPWMLECDVLRDKKVDTLYLDTTYANPRYRFPAQQQTIEAMAAAMRQALKDEPATLFVIAAYRIGKEKVYMGAARALGCKIWVAPAKRRLLHMLDLPAEDLALLADSPEEAQIHVVHWGLKPEALHRYLHRGGCMATTGAEVPGQHDAGGMATAGWGDGVHGGPLASGMSIDEEGMTFNAGGDCSEYFGAGQNEDDDALLRDWDGEGTELDHAPVGAARLGQAGVPGDAGFSGRDHQRSISPGLDVFNRPDGAVGGVAGAAGCLSGAAPAVADAVGPLQGQNRHCTEEQASLKTAEQHSMPSTSSQHCAGNVRGQWKCVLGIRATGWTFSKGGRVRVWRQGPVGVMAVPYSEHSSWTDLCDCVKSLKPKRLVPTVNVGTLVQYKAMIEKFAHLMDLSNDKSRLHFYFKRQCQPKADPGLMVKTEQAYLEASGTAEGLKAGSEVIVVHSDGSGDEGEGHGVRPMLSRRSSTSAQAHSCSPSEGGRDAKAGSQAEAIACPPDSQGQCSWQCGRDQPAGPDTRGQGDTVLLPAGPKDASGSDHFGDAAVAASACVPTASICTSSAAITVKVEVVDLTSVDVGEQERIYQGIVRQQQARKAFAGSCQEAAEPGPQPKRRRAESKPQPQLQQQQVQGQGQGQPQQQKQGKRKGSWQQGHPAFAWQQALGGKGAASGDSVGVESGGTSSRQHGIKAFFSPCTRS